MRYLGWLGLIIFVVVIGVPVLYGGFKIITGMWSEMIEDFRS